jgi:hypothetical protein
MLSFLLLYPLSLHSSYVSHKKQFSTVSHFLPFFKSAIKTKIYNKKNFSTHSYSFCLLFHFLFSLFIQKKKEKQNTRFSIIHFPITTICRKQKNNANTRSHRFTCYYFYYYYYCFISSKKNGSIENFQTNFLKLLLGFSFSVFLFFFCCKLTVLIYLINFFIGFFVCVHNVTH